MLLSHHLDDLKRSGLSDETIAALGSRSVEADEARSLLGFNSGPGLLIPYPNYGTGPTFCRLKPDAPPLIDGERPKYLSPKGAGLSAYIPPKTWEALKDLRAAVLITEGEKKAAAADQGDFPCIGLGGIYGFRDREHVWLPALEELHWQGRTVGVVPDSDVADNPNVADAVWELGWQLVQRGADPSVVVLPPSGDGSKVGLDDFLVAHGKEALPALIRDGEPLELWACSRVAMLPLSAKEEGLEWLACRLKAMGAMRLEFLIPEVSRRLGLRQPWVRKLLREALPWAPSPPKAQREAAEAEARAANAAGPAQEEAQRLREAELEERACTLLRDPALLFKLGDLLSRLGLAGEGRNSRIVYLVVTSRIEEHPISLTVKGESAAGKSFLVGRVLQLFPSGAYLALTGMSRQALVYSQEPVAHRTIVIFERPGMEAADYNIRTLQSEGKIIFETVERNPATNEQRTVRKEKEGPTNFIFTTTAPQIHQENETRHWSIFVDESAGQTTAVKNKIAEQYEGAAPVSPEELAKWMRAQELLRPVRVVIPYTRWLVQHTPNSPLRMRRDFTRLLSFIETIALVHQEQRPLREAGGIPTLTARLEDYFIARVLVGDTFAAEAQGRNVKVAQIVDTIVDLHTKKAEASVAEPTVSVGEVAAALGRVESTIRRWLRPALDNGWVEEAAPAAGRKGARYVPGKPMPDPSPLPVVEEMAEAFPDLARGFRAVHPLTGEVFELEANGSPVAEHIAGGAPA